MKPTIYESLFSINHYLQLVCEHLEKLKAAGILPDSFVSLRAVQVEEMRAEISRRILNELLQPVADTALQFQNLRIKLEHSQNQ